MSGLGSLYACFLNISVTSGKESKLATTVNCNFLPVYFCNQLGIFVRPISSHLFTLWEQDSKISTLSPSCSLSMVRVPFKYAPKSPFKRENKMLKPLPPVWGYANANIHATRCPLSTPPPRRYPTGCVLSAPAAK